MKKKIKPSQKQEFELWSETALFPLKVGHRLPVLKTLVKRGFYCVAISENMFPQLLEISWEPKRHETIPEDQIEKVYEASFVYAQKIMETLNQSFLKEYWTIKKTEPTLTHINNALDKDGYILAFIDRFSISLIGEYPQEKKEHISHWILILGRNKKKGTYNCQDPKQGNYELDEETLLEVLDVGTHIHAPKAIIAVFDKSTKI